LKICVITQAFYPAIKYGGPIFSTLNLFNNLSNFENIDIFVSTTNANGRNEKLSIEVNKYIKIDNLNVKFYNDTVLEKVSIPLICSVYKDMKKCDVIYIQPVFDIAVIFGLIYSKLLHKPIVLSPRGSLGEWPLKNGSRFKKLWLKMLIKPFANYVVWHATSEQEKQDILKLFPNAKVKIIPNGIYIKEFQNFNKLTKGEYIQKFVGIAPNKGVNKIIISMGRLQKKKGFDILIDAFYETLNTYPNSYLLIAGPDEGEKENLNKQIKNLKLEDKVVLIGNIENQDKINFLSNADLFVLPSYNENFGNVYLESLASGTPIVASIGTPWGKVEKYDCGKWVENSVEETSKAMVEMLDKDRDKMRENSLRLASQYDWSSIAIKFKNLFESIL